MGHETAISCAVYLTFSELVLAFWWIAQPRSCRIRGRFKILFLLDFILNLTPAISSIPVFFGIFDQFIVGFK